MKRIFFSCILVLSFVFITHSVRAQVPSYTATPVGQCYQGPVQHTIVAGIVIPVPGASSYTWSVASPTTASCPNPATFSLVTGSNGTIIAIQATCCGIYTLNNQAWAPGNIPIPSQWAVTNVTFEIVCPGGGTINTTNTNTTAVPGTSALCIGNSVQMTLLGTSGFLTTTLTSKPVNGPVNTGTCSNPVVVTPTANTSYTMIGTTPLGCTVSATQTLIVQSASLASSPASATRCVGEPLALTSTLSTITNTNVAPGTVTTQVQWFDPTPAVIASTRTVTTAALAGNYSVVLTHTGVAGTCTLANSIPVTTISTISVAITPTAPSVCPGSAVTLTATSQQTAGASYTWTLPNTNTLTGKTVTDTPTSVSVYTVDVTYYGCTGTQTRSVAMSTITPILTVSNTLTSPLHSTCPNQSLTLSATGGVNYTFSAFPANAPPGFSITLAGASTTNTRTHSPTSIQLLSGTNTAIIYSVNASQAGCVGSASFAVGLLTLNTIITSSISSPSGSACPNTSIVLTTTNGATTTHTWTSNTYTTVWTSTTTGGGAPSGSVNVPVGPLGVAHTFSVVTDSAGCTGSSNITIGLLTIQPKITPAPSFSAICPGSPISLTVSGGAGTSYSFTSPYPTAVGGTNYAMPHAGGVVTSFSTPASTYTPFYTLPTPYTYTVEVDSAGCVGVQTIDIGLYTLTPTLGLLGNPSNSVCNGSSFTLTSSGGSGTTYSFTGSANSGTPAPNQFSVTTSYSVVDHPSALTTPGDFYTYTVSVDSSGCVGTNTLNVGILSLTSNLTLSLNANTNSVCPGTTFTLVADSLKTDYTGMTYTFYAPPSHTTLPNTGSINSTTASVSSSTAFPATYTVAADSAGCVGTQTIIVGLYDLTGLTISASPTIVCANQTVVITASGVLSNSLSPTTYTFASLTGTSTNVVQVGQSPTVAVTPSVLTVYSVLADSLGCLSFTVPPLIPTTTVDISPGLTLTPSSSSPSVCAGLPVTISVTPTGGVPPYIYSWSPTVTSSSGTLIPGVAPNDFSATATPTTNATYTIDAKDSKGCVGQTVITIGIDPNASLSVSLTASQLTVCPGLTSTLTTTCAISPVNYTWAPNYAINPSVGDTVVVTPLISTVYTVTADNGWGCYGTASASITVNQFPNITISKTSNSVCAGYTSTLTAFGAGSYTWTVPPATAGIVQTSVSVGPGTYTVIGSNGGMCLQTIVTSVGSQTPLAITVSPSNATTCISTNGDANHPKLSKPINLTASGAAYYTWSPYNPYYMTYSLGASTTVKPPATTQYTIVGSTAICSGTAVVSVTVIPQFSMQVTPPLPQMCVGDSLKLSIVNIGTLAAGPTSAFQYSWTEQDQTILTIANSALGASIVVVPPINRSYYAEVHDAKGCASLPGVASVTVLPKPVTAVSIPTINNVPTNTLCYVGTQAGPPDIILQLTGTNQNTNLPFGVVPTYTWLSPTKRVSILTPPNNAQIIVSAPERTPSVVVYTLNSGYNGIPGCAEFDTVSVRVIDCRSVDQVTFSTDNGLKGDTICSQTCITFVNANDTAAGGPQTYLWGFDGGSPKTSTEMNPTVCYNLPGRYTVSLTVSNPYPKSLGGSVRQIAAKEYVRVVDVPNVSIFTPGQIKSDTTIRFGQEINLTGSGAFTYSWFPDYRITSTNKTSVTVNPNKTTQYILTGYNSKGCSSSDTLNVIVIEDCGEMYIPNAFTPNGDGNNDVLYVRGQCLQSMTLIIFNRWGEKVFETSDQKVGWDGTYKGELLNTGAFVFRLEGRTFDGSAFTSKGNITLLR